MDLQYVICIADTVVVVKSSKIYINSCETIVRIWMLLISFGIFVFNTLLCYYFLNILKIFI